MRIATYNLWDTRVRGPERLDVAVEELTRLNANIIALQEAAARVGGHNERDANRYLTERCGYMHVETRVYPDDPGEGLLLSKLPLRAVEAGRNTDLPAAVQDSGERPLPPR